MINDMMKMMLGLDEKSEIFNLWYEITYLRMFLSHILSINPILVENIEDEVFDECRKDAQTFVKNRFPNFNIDFERSEHKLKEESEDTCQEDESKSQALETPDTN